MPAFSLESCQNIGRASIPRGWRFPPRHRRLSVAYRNFVSIEIAPSKPSGVSKSTCRVGGRCGRSLQSLQYPGCSTDIWEVEDPGFLSHRSYRTHIFRDLRTLSVLGARLVSKGVSQGNHHKTRARSLASWVLLLPPYKQSSSLGHTVLCSYLVCYNTRGFYHPWRKKKRSV